MMVMQETVDGERLFCWRDLRPRIGNLSRGTVWKLRKSGHFPEPVRLSSKRVAWRESEIARWVSSRTSAA
jgi:prophage regulatory protein